MHGGDLLGAFAKEGENARRHFVQHDAEGIDVAQVIEGLALRLLGADVMHGADGNVTGLFLNGIVGEEAAEGIVLSVESGRFLRLFGNEGGDAEVHQTDRSVA